MIVDIIIIVALVIFVLAGVKKGMISCLIDILAFGIALVLALMLCKPITNTVIENTTFDESLKTTISENIPLSDTDFKVEEDVNLPSAIIDYISGITEEINTSKEDAINAIAEELSKDIITVIVFVAIFIVVRIVLMVVKAISKIIDKIPGLKQINKLGGGICGAIEGAIAIYAILAVISMISPMIASTNIISLIQNSNIGALMYNDNILLSMIL